MSYIEVADKIWQCPTAYHVVERVRQESMVLPFGSTVDSLSPNIAYVVEKNGTSAVLFSVPPELDPAKASFDIVAAHTDSPAFKVKTNPVSFDGGYIRLNVEKYGGMLVRTWLDRPVSVAGRVFIKDAGSCHVFSRLIDMRDTCRGTIPSLAPHQDRDIESKELSIQNHMRPVIGLAANTDCSPEEYFRKLVCQALNRQGSYSEASPDDIVSWDLFVYDVEKPSFLVNGMSWDSSPYAADLFMSPRIDNQASVWCALDGFMSAAIRSTERKPDAISVLAVFDAEEVGSGCAAGADSDFLSEVLRNVASVLGFGDNRSFSAALSRSMLASADGGHALHPAYPSLSDPTNPCVLGGGIMLKHAGTHAYMTDGLSAAVFADLCFKAGISFQNYQNNSDVGGGKTLGSLLSMHLGVAGFDVGVPQLAMHSACELASARDVEDFSKFFEAFYGCKRVDVR